MIDFRPSGSAPLPPRADYGHELKCWPEFFQAIRDERKTFDVRRRDREFHAGDQVLFREWEPATCEYTGRVTARRIGYIQAGGQFGVEEGYCVLGLEP